MTLKLEVGKKYRNRKGEVVEIINMSPHFNLPFTDGKYTYAPNGKYWTDGGETIYDLIEEVIDEPAQEPVKKPIKWAKEAHAWIDGIEVEWKQPDTGTWFSPKGVGYNPVQDNYLEWRIAVPQWRKDLAKKMKAGGVLETFNPGESVAIKSCFKIEDVLDPEQNMDQDKYRIRPEPQKCVSCGREI
jgi:hypothetical protein